MRCQESQESSFSKMNSFNIKKQIQVENSPTIIPQPSVCNYGHSCGFIIKDDLQHQERTYGNSYKRISEIFVFN